MAHLHELGCTLTVETLERACEILTAVPVRVPSVIVWRKGGGFDAGGPIVEPLRYPKDAVRGMLAHVWEVPEYPAERTPCKRFDDPLAFV